MCAYENISEANQGNHLNESWEKNFGQFSETPHIPVDSGQNDISTTNLQDYQAQTCTAYQNSESSSSFSPTRGDTVFEIPQNSTNMSTYFSTFNPSTQFQENSYSLRQSPVVKTSPILSTQNTTRNGKMQHQARINFIPSGKGTFKAIVKRKRKRTVFTTEQLEALEAVFSKKPYVTRDERQVLVEQLLVNDKSIKVWFQNRRLKNKRGDDHYETMQADSAIFDRLDTVESQIKERTDEFGYVTLDDQIMSELVSVIDDFFTSKVSQAEAKLESDYSPIYEPISPASPATNSDHSCDENVMNWQQCEPNDSTQNLVDLESFLSK